MNILNNILPNVGKTQKEEKLESIFNQENEDSVALDDFEDINQKVFAAAPEYNLDSSSEDQPALIVEENKESEMKRQESDQSAFEVPKASEQQDNQQPSLELIGDPSDIKSTISTLVS
jgi:hypothetical protein